MSTRTQKFFRRAVAPSAVLILAMVLTGCGTAPVDGPALLPAAQPTAAPDLTYLALGDSTVFGAPDLCNNCITYPYILRGKLAAQFGKSVRLWDGSQANDPTFVTLAAEIDNDAWIAPTAGQNIPSPAAAIAGADIITISLNDNSIPFSLTPDPCGYHYDAACIAKTEVPFIHNVKTVLTQIRKLRAGKPVSIRLTTQYNFLIPGTNYEPDYPAKAVAQARTSAKTFLDRWNGDLCTVARQNGALCVDTYHGINGKDGLSALPPGWLSSDYPSLNQAGQKYIASEMMYLGWDPLKLN